MKRLISVNPANYEVLGEVKTSSEREIKGKVKKANQAKEEWKNLGLKKRIRLLKKVYQAFEGRKNELGELVTKEVGMPASARDSIEINTGLDYFKWYLENAGKCLSPEITWEDKETIHTIFYEPTGVAAVICPWNFPFSNFIWAVIPNLIVGNAVVFKHAEECSLSALRIEKIVNQCGLPEGVFNQVYGDGKVGDFLVHQDIDLICFTGSTKVGEYLYQVAAKKFIKVVLELGGSSPGLVFEGADVDKAVELVYLNRFTHAGQVCDGLKRLIVHKSRFKEVIEKLKAYVESKKVGDPQNPTTDIGPLVSKKQLKILRAQMADALKKGAKVVTGGKSPQGLRGAFYLPTILTHVTRDMRVWQEEVFGPVLPVVKFETEKEAIKLANDTKYGLSAYIYTKDSERAKRVVSEIEAGMICVDPAYYLLPCNPFGGWKRSGLGRENGRYGLQELCQIKVISTGK